jgi:hypothetical protein
MPLSLSQIVFPSVETPGVATDASLDADMILAAQAGSLIRAGDETVIATTNVRQLEMFAPARIWREIG